MWFDWCMCVHNIGVTWWCVVYISGIKIKINLKKTVGKGFIFFTHE